jgi:hypothetical protein
MKLLCSILIYCLTFFVAAGQNRVPTQYKCFIKKDCSDSVVPYRNYAIIKKGQSIDSLIEPNKNFVCLLPDTGTYGIIVFEEKGFFFIMPKQLFFTSAKGIIDTLETCDLGQFSTTYDSTKYDSFLFCGKIANGHIIDNTMDGWREGDFKNGIPLSLKFFSKEGKLTRSFCFDQNGYSKKCN